MDAAYLVIDCGGQPADRGQSNAGDLTRPDSFDTGGCGSFIYMPKREGSHNTTWGKTMIMTRLNACKPMKGHTER